MMSIKKTKKKFKQSKFNQFMNKELPISQYAFRLILINVFFIISVVSLVILSTFTYQSESFMWYWFHFPVIHELSVISVIMVQFFYCTYALTLLLTTILEFRRIKNNENQAS